jgi:hypothetical protein
MNATHSLRQTLLLCFCLLGVFFAGPSALAAAKVQPWMLADWENPAPHLADTGFKARDIAVAIGPRLVILPHAPRDIALPGADGPRRFVRARFLSAVARVDLPAATLRRRLQDFSGYKNLFPLMPESEVVALDGRNQVARYRVEVPLPALADFIVDFRVKERLEEDGSISFMLIDGKAESLIAMLGGMTDELADQPVAGRWEFLPLNDKQSLVVFTYWDRIELKSFFARKLMEAYPELKVAGPYMIAMLGAEPIRRAFVARLPSAVDGRPQGMQQLQRLRGLLERASANGHVAVLEPEPAPAKSGQPAALRYAGVATRIAAPLADTRRLATTYERLPEAIKEMKEVVVEARGQQSALDLDLRFAVLIIRFSLDLDMLNTWETPQRLDFRRTAGGLAQLHGASEWHALPASGDTLMLTSAAYEIGEEAPLVLRLAHRLSARLPHIDQAGSLVAQLVIMERLKPWMERNATGKTVAADVAEETEIEETVHE